MMRKHSSLCFLILLALWSLQLATSPVRAASLIPIPSSPFDKHKDPRLSLRTYNHTEEPDEAEAEDEDVALWRRAPVPPTGARVAQHKPSTKTDATVPVFVNSKWVGKADGGKAGKGITKAWIGLHGKGRDGVATFQDLYPIIGTTGTLIIPNFYAPEDIGQATTDGYHVNYMNSDLNLLWDKEGWFAASDAVLGGKTRPLNGAKISSFDVVDSLVKQLSDKARYPDMKRITIAGHSAGGVFVDLYARFGKSTPDGKIKFRYITANPPANYFEDKTRPVLTTDYLPGCPEFDDFPSGSSGTFPRYLSQQGAASSRLSFADSMARDVVRLVGSKDTFKTGNQIPGCDAVAQGGMDRLARNQNIWVMENLRAKSGNDMSLYQGYRNLTEQQSTIATDARAPLPFRHTFAIVPGVGHDSGRMFASDYGRQALLNSAAPVYKPVLKDGQTVVPY